jgi:hypothetical protein
MQPAKAAGSQPGEWIKTMTLTQAIEQAHCRRGKAAGTTKDGAYWLAVDSLHIRSFGGDGIGNGARSCDNYLELRHYRDGQTRARVHMNASHQNGVYGGAGDWYANADAILPCESAEAVIVALKGISVNDTRAYSDEFAEQLTAALMVQLDMPEADPSPDEAA